MFHSEEPVRVLRVIARLNMGGPALHVAYLTAGLASRGYDTTLVAGSLARGEDSMAFVADELADTIGGILGKPVEKEYLPPRAGDVRDSWADVSEARRLLGFEPKIGLEEGLRRTVDALVS